MSDRMEVSRRQLFAVAGLGLTAGLIRPEAVPASSDVPTTDLHDLPRELSASGADLGTLFADVAKLAAERRYSMSFLSDRFRDLKDFQTATRKRVFELLRYRPAKIEPLAEVVERVEREDHIREKIMFSTSPHFRVPAYVLIPRNLKKPAPAIVDLHSHGGMFVFGKEKVIDLGRNHPAMETYHQRNYDGRPTATALVKRGYIVITIDAFGFGERRILLDADLGRGWDRARYSLDDVQHLNQQCRGKESTIAKSLVFAGASWPGIVFHDDIRTVDYLVTRSEVDPGRIGCVGISMGGYRAAYLSALDERIKAACVVGFMSTVGPMLKAHIDTHSWVHFLPGLHEFLDLPDVASLTAPRALLVQQCSQDRLFPLPAMQDSVRKIGQAYDNAGVRDKFSGRFYDAPHQFTRPMQDEAFAWLDQHLSG